VKKGKHVRHVTEPELKIHQEVTVDVLVMPVKT
jgi:hypothetical protein